MYCIAFISCIVFWPIAVLFIKYYHDCKYYRARGHEKAKREKSHEDIGVFHLNLFLNNEFIRCFHQFVSLFFSMKFSQFEQLKKKTDFLLVQNSFFLSLPVKKEIIINVRKRYSEFEIDEFLKSLAHCAKNQNYKRAK